MLKLIKSLLNKRRDLKQIKLLSQIQNDNMFDFGVDLRNGGDKHEK